MANDNGFTCSLGIALMLSLAANCYLCGCAGFRNIPGFASTSDSTSDSVSINARNKEYLEEIAKMLSASLSFNDRLSPLHLILYSHPDSLRWFSVAYILLVFGHTAKLNPGVGQLKSHERSLSAASTLLLLQPEPEHVYVLPPFNVYQLFPLTWLQLS